MKRFSAFLSGGSFPAFAISALLLYQLFVAFMAFTPARGGAWAGFVDDFRVRCFKLNSASGGMDWGSVWTMLLEPLPLQLILLFIWREQLLNLLRDGRRVLVPLGGAFLLVMALAFGLLSLGRAQAKTADLPFPADRLRSALPMPPFSLTNQDGQSISLGALRGRVVLVTAVYSTCTTTCPMMLTKIRTIIDKLAPEERYDLAVVAFSLAPEADTRELRAMTARMYGMSAPQFHFVSGVPADVNALLDQLNVARIRDEKTGQITHSNLFFLLDREGRIAYRLSQSEREQSWLLTALRLLLSEKRA